MRFILICLAISVPIPLNQPKSIEMLEARVANLQHNLEVLLDFHGIVQSPLTPVHRHHKEEENHKNVTLVEMPPGNLGVQ